MAATRVAIRVKPGSSRTSVGGTYGDAIIGAGPAGSAAPLAARRAGASVVLVDRSDFPRDKACGDAISSHAVQVLRALGAGSAVAGSASARWFELAGESGQGETYDLRGYPEPMKDVP